MKVKVSNYSPKAFLSDTQQIWHKKCLIKLIILAKAREMLLSHEYGNKLIGTSQLPFPWSAQDYTETNLQDKANINIYTHQYMSPYTQRQTHSPNNCP